MIGDKTVYFEELDHFSLKEYDAIKEYGGWGLRSKKNKKAYTVSGKHGIQLLLKNGKMILIGTQKPKSFAKAIEGKLSNKTIA
jgi:hypothetical protein